MEERIREIVSEEVTKAFKSGHNRGKTHPDEVLVGEMWHEAMDRTTQAILTAVAESIPQKYDIWDLKVEAEWGLAHLKGFNRAIDEVLAQLGKEE